MQIYAAILEMLKQQEHGVLVTVIGCSPSCRWLMGKHFLYKVGFDEGALASLLLDAEWLQQTDATSQQQTDAIPQQHTSAEWQQQIVPECLQKFPAVWQSLGTESLQGIPAEYADGLQENLLAICLTALTKQEFGRTRVEWAQVSQETAGLKQSEQADKPINQVQSATDLHWLDVMLEPIVPAPRLLIFGCGHVGQALAWLAHLSELPVTVVDDRPIFANGGLFPTGTEVLCDDFTRAIERLNPGGNDFAVIVTRGHQYDRVCLSRLVGRQMAYVGMIGSKRRVAGLFQEMIREGADPEWLEHVHSPIGLDIGAETPAEIAVSIMAELIRVRRKGA